MGARAQIAVKQDNRDRDFIYLYTHWGSGEVIARAAKGIIEGRSRWNDCEYFTRIMFDRMKGNDTESETGFGIGLTPHFDCDSIILVDGEKGLVNIFGYSAPLVISDTEESAAMIIGREEIGGLRLTFAGTFHDFVDRSEV